MGNRAVISFSTSPAAPSIYLHWNGGRASVEGFLAGCLEAGYAPPATKSRTWTRSNAACAHSSHETMSA